jgi:hypothetical protein
VTIEYQQQRYKFLSWDYSGSFDCVGKPHLGVWGEENLLIERLLSDRHGVAQIAAFEKQLKFPVRPIPRFDSSSDVTISIGHGMGRVDDPAGILLIKEPYTDGNGRTQICSVFLNDSESIIRLQEKLQEFRKVAQLPSKIAIRLALDSKKLAAIVEENLRRCQQTLAH